MLPADLASCLLLVIMPPQEMEELLEFEQTYVRPPHPDRVMPLMSSDAKTQGNHPSLRRRFYSVITIDWVGLAGWRVDSGKAVRIAPTRSSNEGIAPQ